MKKYYLSGKITGDPSFREKFAMYEAYYKNGCSCRKK